MTDTVRRTNQIEAEFDDLIARRYLDRVNGRGGFDPTPEQAWDESERRHAEGLRRATRWEWLRYHEGLAALFRRMADEHAAKAAALLAEIEAS